MCGIFGVVSGSSDFGVTGIRNLTKDLFLLSESRGKEASGMAAYAPGSMKIARHPYSASSFIRSQDFESTFSGLRGGQDGSERMSILGHCRLVTNGGKIQENNNQPVQYDDVVAIHNGIVVNVEKLWSENSQLVRSSEVDSEVIAALVNEFSREMPLVEAVQKTFSLIEGAVSTGLISKSTGDVVLATNTGSIYYIVDRKKGLVVFASEESFLTKLARKTEYSTLLRDALIQHLPAGHGIQVSADGQSRTEFSCSLSLVSKPHAERILRIKDVEPAPADKPSESVLKRCSKCVLPHTFPYISFDEKGVCSFCKSYRPIQTSGEGALEKALAPLRRSDGRPDIIVTFSGGRDSSYALHMLKTKYHMNPIAFTYDWGMVTDLARRNQARMCGQLGVEHIIMSADIEKKRRNIGYNVKAWLKKPDLGMIPLFMAGDKQFFYYFNKFRKQLKLDGVVFSVNPLEKTGFKTGFCRVDQGASVQPYNNKLGITSYYLRQFLTNPAYLNASLPDTFSAYLSAYFLKHDYLMFFDYEPWHEDEVNDVLLNQYGWEVATDSTSTWRIGDGTAAFYNYIYEKVVGFTENDAFRSNQIREGYISRDQALAILSVENNPRWDSIREYLGLIDVDFEKAISTIDRIPRLY